MKITLDYPPALNNLYFNVGRRRVLSKAGRLYKERAALMAMAAGARPVDGPVVVFVDVYRPRKIGDLDGCFKAIFDALKGVAWHDDKQVIEIHARRFDDKESPRAEVTIEPAKQV